MTEKTEDQMVRVLAERGMGWKIFDVSVSSFPGYPVLVQKGDHWKFYAHDGSGQRWNPFTSISDAFMLVEKMGQNGWWMNLSTGCGIVDSCRFSFGSIAAPIQVGNTPCRAIALAGFAALEGK